MITEQVLEVAWTEKERAAFSEKVRTFWKRLPAEQRKAFGGIIGGASVVLRPSKRAGAEVPERGSFAQTLATFRDELQPRERDALTSMVAAGSVAWGAAAGQAPEDDVRTIAMLHALAPAAAIITVGAFLIISELIEDDEEILIPDIQFPD